MRESLKVSHSTLPAYVLSSSEEAALAAKMAEWKESNFAGFQRALDPGSDCYPDLKAISDAVRGHSVGIKDFVVLGIGGSSLGTEAILRALRPSSKEPRFHFADNSDPQTFRWLIDSLKPDSTLFYVVAKSGSTPETLSQFLVAKDWLGANWKKHFVACTDPEKGDLRALSKRWGLTTLPLPSAIGGRFSVLTSVGLFPAAFAGFACGEFLKGASSVAAWESRPWKENPAAQLGISLAKASKNYPVTVLMPYSSQLSAFSRWFCQLWGESLGKNGKGLTPYPAVGATDQHSQLQLYMEGPKDKCMVFVQIHDRGNAMPIPFPEELGDLSSFSILKGKSVGQLIDAEYRATRDAVTKQGIPNASLEVDKLDAYSLGALFYFWEVATAVAGAVLDVNPFDQPGVEAAKILTKKYLG